MKVYLGKISIVAVFFAFSTFSAAIAVALEGSTTMTVVNVTSWQSDQGDVSDYDETAYVYDMVANSSGQFWRIRGGSFDFPTYHYTPVTGVLWVVKSTDGRTFSAKSWDYIGNTTTFKHLGYENAYEDWVGMMATSLCKPWQNECKARQRSNLIFTKQTH